MAKKEYLGDGVYAQSEPLGIGVILTTDNGVSETNRIYLEPEVLDAFLHYLERSVAAHARAAIEELHHLMRATGREE